MHGARLMRVEVTVPVGCADEVVRDLRGRGGKLSERKQDSTSASISGTVPLEAMSNYGADLRSMSDGHGTFRMAIRDGDEDSPRELSPDR